MSTVQHFGARGDGKTDDTAAISHAIQSGDGSLIFPRGDYIINRPLVVPLEMHGRISIDGQGGGARLVMTGPGPALHLVGTHQRSAQPDHVEVKVWQRQRLPTVHGLEVLGQHPEADGIRVEGAMQPILSGLLIRKCRHGVHLASRDRNVSMSDCHIYNNSGIGLFLDQVNLHQINIHGNHISYCKQGGIRIEGSEIRNIQICSNDIEYNFDLKSPTSADVLFDCRNGTVREGTIVGNTIQASASPDGANVRLLGVGRDNPNAVGLLAITGNLIGSQNTALHLVACRGVVVSGNSIYSGYQHAILAEDAEHLVINGNSIDHNPEYKGGSTDRVVMRGCRNVTFSGIMHQHTRGAVGEDPASWEFRDCQNLNITGCQIANARVRGIIVQRSAVVRVADCTIQSRADAAYRTAISVDEFSRHVMVVNNFLGKGTDGSLRLPKEAGTEAGNIVL